MTLTRLAQHVAAELRLTGANVYSVDESDTRVLVAMMDPLPAHLCVPVLAAARTYGLPAFNEARTILRIVLW